MPDRRALWGAVYQRWRDWDFAEAGTLLGPQPSAVDLALVGYGVEVLSAADLAALVAEFDRGFDSGETDWHCSLADFVAARNRAASRLAPFAHAQQVVARKVAHWLPPALPTLPTRARSGYLDAKFRIS